MSLASGVGVRHSACTHRPGLPDPLWPPFRGTGTLWSCARPGRADLRARWPLHPLRVGTAGRWTRRSCHLGKVPRSGPYGVQGRDTPDLGGGWPVKPTSW